jgi:DNA mismatch endonuclease (patch repair protein)
MDLISKKQRSDNMRAVTGKHTTPELLVRKAAHALGLRFRLHKADMPGRPDLVFARWRTVIFVNGCFWHQHRGCKRATVPKTNVEFWQIKLEGNVRRDRQSRKLLKALGWRVFVIWECQIPDRDKATKAVRRLPIFRHC